MDDDDDGDGILTAFEDRILIQTETCSVDSDLTVFMIGIDYDDNDGVPTSLELDTNLQGF